MLTRLSLILTLSTLPAISWSKASSQSAEAFYKSQAQKDLGTSNKAPGGNLPLIIDVPETDDYEDYGDIDHSASWAFASPSETSDKELGWEFQEPRPSQRKSRTMPRNFQTPGLSAPVTQNQPSSQINQNRGTLTPAGQNRMAIEPVNPQPQSEFGIGATFLSGYSSNVAQFEGAPAASFFDLNANMNGYYPVGSILDLEFQGRAFYRGFQNPEINDQFQTLFIDGEASAKFLISESYYAKVTGGRSQFDGRQLDFRSNTERGIDSRFSINRALITVGRNWMESSLELFIGQELLDAQTPAIDEFGNEFLTDFTQNQVGAKYGQSWGQRVDWEVTYQFANRTFDDQRARLLLGGIPEDFERGALLREQEHSLMSSLFMRFFEAHVGFRRIEDQATGGATRSVFTVGVATPFRLFSRFHMRPDIQWSNTSFDNFIGNIINDPTANDLRQDTLLSYGLEASLDFDVISPVFNFRRSQMQTNYEILQFEEDIVSGGLRVTF